MLRIKCPYSTPRQIFKGQILMKIKQKIIPEMALFPAAVVLSVVTIQLWDYDDSTPLKQRYLTSKNIYIFSHQAQEYIYYVSQVPFYYTILLHIIHYTVTIHNKDIVMHDLMGEK